VGKKLRVAFAMGGGASLGAFSGGAISEVVRQLHDNLDGSVYDGVEIDVLSGASAGGMTVGLLVRALADPLNRTETDAVDRVGALMREAWVAGIGVDHLVPSPEMDHRASLLDRGAVDALARRLLEWPSGRRPETHMLGRRVCLGLTLLNYNGIPITLSKDPALRDALTTTLFRDYRVCCLDFAAVETPVPARWTHFDVTALSGRRPWTILAATMIAGGAVPLAFESVVLRRLREEYGALWPDELADREEFLFTHGDGGTFDNEPLRQAMRMAGYLDAGAPADSFDRVLISIDPNVSGSVHDFALDFHRSHEINPDYGLFDGEDVVPADSAGRLVSNAARLVTALRGQASFKDYLGADKVNHRLRWRDEGRRLLSELVGAIKTERVAEIGWDAEASLARVLKEKRAVSSIPDTALEVETELRRVRAEIGVAEAAADEPRVRLECVLLSLLDQVAALRRKQPVSLWAIAPHRFRPVGADPAESVPVELAGDFAASFGGFFDQTFREHDFALGAAVAASVLSQPPVSGPLEGGLLADPEARPAMPSPVDAQIGTNPNAADRFAQRVGHVAEAVIKSRVTNQIARLLVAPRVRSAVSGMVGRSAPERAEATLRVLVRVPEPSEADRFHLEASEGGDDSEDILADADGVAALVTVVRFSPRGEVAVEGPHVHAGDAGPELRIRRSRRGRSDPEAKVLLPEVDRLRKEMSYGLPVHEVELAWERRATGPWTTRNALEGLEDAL
jgi:predicted acylesterase/phospholipase RssA